MAPEKAVDDDAALARGLSNVEVSREEKAVHRGPPTLGRVFRYFHVCARHDRSYPIRIKKFRKFAFINGGDFAEMFSSLSWNFETWT